MKKISRSLLAAALMMALPVGGALACTVGNWNGANTATDAESGGPADGVARYQGLCALSVGSGEYVIDKTPAADGTYRARFYVLTGATSAPGATVFKASSTDDNSGAAVVEVIYNGSAFEFKENGASVGSPVSAAQGKWFSVEIAYKAGGAFNAWVQGAGGTSEANVNKATAGAGTVDGAVLGISSGSVTSNFNFDSFVSTRGDDRIERLCRGDATGDGSLNIADRMAINQELAGVSYQIGQPDCTEDGTMNIADRLCVNQRLLAADTCP